MTGPWLPLALPMVLFLICTTLESYFAKEHYPFVYSAKVLIVGASVVFTARQWKTLVKWKARPVLLGVVAGAIGLGLWIVLDKAPRLSFMGTRAAYDPTILGTWMVPFLAVRFLGLAIMVPIIEELFWRGFLLRWISDMEKWDSLPVEKFTPVAALIVSGLFAVAHPEWLAALVYGLGLCWLLKSTKSLAACITAHAVTNLLLGIYILYTKNWALW
ncbi:MAG: CAAX prenyl protease-related protein [Armatimonas sp.]